MRLMRCPLNGLRDISEFAYGGEVEEMPDPRACSDAEWADHVFNRDNACGTVREWWCHLPTVHWFIAERDTATDEIFRTYPADRVFGKRTGP